MLDLLLSFLKTEQLVSIRRETLRVLGLLGALDPYKHKMNLGHIDSQVCEKERDIHQSLARLFIFNVQRIGLGNVCVHRATQVL